MPKPSAASAILPACLFIAAALTAQTNTPETGFERAGSAKIQMAILLDVSNSMDGLIKQAKSQLWNTVLTFSKLSCGGVAADFEIAIYEYGRSDNDPRSGYVRQIMPFSRDLDLLSSRFNSLSTNGGEEYCGQVIQRSLTELKWDTSANTYKTIFIAGNESFQQGSVKYPEACQLAVQKGVIVNTIYCGNMRNGISENWDLGNRCGNGSFSYINQDATEFWVPTPYDSVLITLKEKFNETYVPYGPDGKAYYNRMTGYDTVAISNIEDPNMIEKYIVIKTDPVLYNNSDWDMVDAYEKDSLVIHKVDMNTLETGLRRKTRNELKQYIVQLSYERRKIRANILEVEEKQKNFIAAAKKNAGWQHEENTLENQIQKVIINQAARFNMKIKAE